MQPGRKITVSLEVVDDNSQKVWLAHRDNFLLSGCRVLSIRDGTLDEIVEEEIDLREEER